MARWRELRSALIGKNVSQAAREMDAHCDILIATAAQEKSDLLSIAKFHKLAAEGSGDKAVLIAKYGALAADQQAVIDVHSKMKAENKAALAGKNVSPAAREMDAHCEALINAAVQEKAELLSLAKLVQ